MATGTFPREKRPRRGVDHPLPSSTEVKGRVELYLYTSLGLRRLFCSELYLYRYWRVSGLACCNTKDTSYLCRSAVLWLTEAKPLYRLAFIQSGGCSGVGQSSVPATLV
jgi:hypothetical protein